MESIEKINMVRNQVRVVGVEDERILAAMLDIERQNFVIEAFKKLAYSDSELPIDNTRLIARPEMIAKFLESAQITSDDVVLEVGCGTGYASHIISRIAQNVLGVDNCKKIISTANKLCDSENLSFQYQDFKKISVPEDASLIIVNGAVFDKRADFSTIEDKSDLFDFHSAMLIDELLSKMPKDCRLLSVEGYYKYHPMSVVKYSKDAREILDQVYFPELVL